MSDVLEQGARAGRPGSRPWVRWGALGVVGLVAAALVTQVGLLSGEQPATHRSPVGADRPRVVVHEEDRLVRYGPQGRTTLARLPAGLSPSDRLVAVDGPEPASAVVGVADGVLFRVELPGGRLSRLGAATGVVGPAGEPGQLFVLVGERSAGRLVAVDAETGLVVEPEPFPGFDGSAGWLPRGSVDAPGLVGMLLSRSAGAGRVELAVAWERRAVVGGAAPPLQGLGTTGRLLGVTGGVVLALGPGCPGLSCRIEIVGLHRDGVSTRSVEPPAGWSFVPDPPPLAAYQPLVAVARPDDPGRLALARVIAGGRSALLLPGSEGARPTAAVVDQPDGDIYLVLADERGTARLARWSPTDASGVTVLAGLPTLAPTARLVAVRE